MDSAPNTLPTGVTELTELVLTLQARLTHQDAFIEQLLEQIRLARHRHFGARSEKFSVDQMTLPFDEDVTGKKGIPDSSSVPSTDDADTEDTEADQITVGPYQRKAGGHRRLPPELPRIEIRYALERSDCQCGRCHGALQPIAEQVSEQLDIVPARVQVLRHDRLQYGCPKCEGEIKVATMPDQPIPKGLASPGTLSHIAVAKYRDGLPLYRPVQQLNRIGLEIPRSTLASWMIQSGKLVQPLINLLRDRLLAYDIISMDETRLQVLKEPGRTVQSQSYL